MMRTVQLSIADARYAAALRDALARSGPWQIEFVDRPNLALPCVLVLDETAFDRLALPLMNPERVVLITRQDPQLLAEAWEAGIVSVVSNEDSASTVLLAIMAAGLRVGKHPRTCTAGGISPNPDLVAAPITPQNQVSRPKRCKTQ